MTAKRIQLFFMLLILAVMAALAGYNAGRGRGIWYGYKHPIAIFFHTPTAP